MLRCGGGIHGAHASGRGDYCQTVKLAAYNGQARLLRHMSAVQFFFNLRNLFFECAYDRDGCHAIPPNSCKLLIHGMVPAFWFFHFLRSR